MTGAYAAAAGQPVKPFELAELVESAEPSELAEPGLAGLPRPGSVRPDAADPASGGYVADEVMR